MQKNEEKNNNIIRLEKSISNILVVNKSKLNPYIEVFEYQAENVSLQNLGTLLGFFKMKDFSEDSTYIVNFLTSVLKKEYYSNAKRGVNNSFDAALHKANLALAELAKHGNIKWLGNLDAAICVLEKTNLHFSVCGKAKILLLRNKNLLDISEGFNELDEPNPLKTFMDVSSGHLEDKDKLLITSDDIFQVFSLNELKKASQRFANDKFIQFIQTALVNEKELAATFIVDIFKPEENATKKLKEKKTKYYQNAFSEKTFQEQKSARPEKSELEIILAEKKEEYTDEKTGHIYVQDQKRAESGEPSSNYYWLLTKEKLSATSHFFKQTFRNVSVFFKRNFHNSFNDLKKFSAETKKTWKIKKATKKEMGNIPADIELEKAEEKQEEEIIPEIAIPEVSVSEIKEAPVKIPFLFPKFPVSKETFLKYYGKIFSKIKSGSAIIKKVLSLMLPNFSKIKRLFHSMDRKHKMSAFLVVLAIIIFPLVSKKINSLRTTPSKKNITEIVEQNADKPLDDKNVKILKDGQDLYKLSGSIGIINGNDKIFLISKDKLTSWNENASADFALPQNSGNIIASSWMKDLKMIFLLTDQNKIVSFTTANSKFHENNIEIPQDSQIKNIGTYLTYIYLFDSKNNQIYRYPRAEGGFGAKTSWLKSELDLSKITNVAMDENIYIGEENQILKFFKGQKQDFNLEKTFVLLKINRIFTNLETANIYVLDKENKRIEKFDKQGVSIANYFNKKLTDTIDFSVDEKNNKLYIVTSDGLTSFNLE